MSRMLVDDAGFYKEELAVVDCLFSFGENVELRLFFNVRLFLWYISKIYCSCELAKWEISLNGFSSVKLNPPNEENVKSEYFYNSVLRNYGRFLLSKIVNASPIVESYFGYRECLLMLNLYIFFRSLFIMPLQTWTSSRNGDSNM